ncbi:MAG: 3-octaprenyl-4-hydroxybenzoate carboxy-lyase, partial [Herbaspirillum sp.]|nr:3-octaprenyl-4-hydroxybenzoate carboxy-lyase [Herbaspirillum sp.]
MLPNDKADVAGIDALDIFNTENEPARAYPDLHDHVRHLAEEGKLWIIDRPVNKDTEMHPLVRWQFRGGIEEKDRKAFLFLNPTDSKGKRYEHPVLVAGLAGSKDIYRIGFGRPLEEIGKAWLEAVAKPIAPVLVIDAPCQQVVIEGEALKLPGNA